MYHLCRFLKQRQQQQQQKHTKNIRTTTTTAANKRKQHREIIKKRCINIYIYIFFFPMNFVLTFLSDFCFPTPIIQNFRTDEVSDEGPNTSRSFQRYYCAFIGISMLCNHVEAKIPRVWVSGIIFLCGKRGCFFLWLIDVLKYICSDGKGRTRGTTW